MTCLDDKCTYILKGPSRLEHILIAAICPAVGLCLSWYLSTWISSKFFPVIENFEVHSIHIENNRVTASGTMEKVKTCELVATNVYVIKNKSRTLVRTFTAKDFGGQLSTGKQAWGPYTVLLSSNDVEMIDIVATHNCGLWYQETFYGSIYMKSIK